MESLVVTLDLLKPWCPANAVYDSVFEYPLLVGVQDTLLKTIVQGMPTQQLLFLLAKVVNLIPIGLLDI